MLAAINKCILCFVLLFSLMINCQANDGNSLSMTVKIISRPIEKKGKVIPDKTNGAKHYAIVSDALIHGIWEMGPDDKGMIATSDSVKNLEEWHTHTVTQNCLDLGGDYVHSQLIVINKKGLLDAIKLYEENFVGRFRYDPHHQNENYAVATIIYAAGGPKLKLK